MTHHISYSELSPQAFYRSASRNPADICSMVLSTISCGSVQLLSGFAFSQSRANCLSKEGWPCPGFVAICRPETGAVRCEHLITDHHVSFFIQTEFEFGICNDDTFAQCVFCTFFIQCNGVVTKFLSQFLTSSREVFFQVRLRSVQKKYFHRDHRSLLW